MSDHTLNLVQTLWLIVLSIFMVLTISMAWKLDSQIVGKSPEGFHRQDANELMEALCLMNSDMACPNPYNLPTFRVQTTPGITARGLTYK